MKIGQSKTHCVIVQRAVRSPSALIAAPPSTASGALGESSITWSLQRIDQNAALRISAWRTGGASQTPTFKKYASIFFSAA